MMAFWLNNQSDIGLWKALTLTSFNVTSIVTTTGFATTDYTQWGQGAVGLFLVLMFVGGCSGSTSGAIKIYRYQILLQIVRTHIKQLGSPNRVLSISFNGRRLSNEVPFSILAFLAVFVATISLFTLALTFMGLDLVTAYSASVTAITNVGPGLGPIIGPAGNFATLPDGAKWLLSAAMILGRLELFTLLVMFDRDFWGI
jgi:trk system potassium uptake protein TrkH